MKLLANNKKAFHEYHILEKIEAGVSLKGTEVKSIKDGKVNIKESYLEINKGEVFIHGMHVSPYKEGNIYNEDPLRVRKLLMHQKEIQKFYKEITQSGTTMVPLKVYVNDKGLIKIEVALAKGKKLYDKRESLKEKDASRQIDRALKNIRG